MSNISLLLERFLSAQKDDLISYFDVDEIVELINYFLELDDTANLKSVIELGYELHPDDIHFKIALCKTLASMEDFNSAMKLIEEIDVKNNKEIDLLRIECFCELDKYDEAIELIDELTTQNCPYLEDIIIQMACVLNDIEKFQEKAYAFIQYALTLFPDNFTLKSELCFNFELCGKTKEAMDLCKELIREDPYSAEIWYMQGRLYSICADFEKAVESLHFALTCIEDNHELAYEIKLMKAFCLYKNESYDKAIECYKEIISDDEFVNSQINPFLAECYMNINEYEKAYQILKQVLDYKGGDDEVSVYGNFIYCCIETERRKEAIDILGEALKRFPHSILEYIATLNIIKNQQPGQYTGKEGIVYPGELARNYLSSNIHNN
ncbi:tetratricopeptide repeat protein [Bacteroides sp. OttesenSCG-928-D19]|nr:tetratricopeptide repeat protein [Bacteroides sp. OttesenSCG-928-D19]